MVLPHFGPGGSQRVASLLLQEWSNRGLRCALITTFDNPKDAYTLAPGITRKTLFIKSKMFFWQKYLTNLKSSGKKLLNPSNHAKKASILEKYVFRILANFLIMLNFLTRAYKLRRELAEMKPKVVISFLSITNIMAITASYGRKWHLIISERNDPARQALNPPFNKLRKSVYKYANLVTANTKAAVTHMEDFVPKIKLKYIPNPISHFPHVPGATNNKGLLFVGRLVSQKGIDLLINAFAATELPANGWHLDVVGDGPDRQKLEQLVIELKLQKHIIFHGHQQEPERFFQKNRIFVLPSLYEGMPNVLLEAMMYGMPSVVSDASPGPVELVESGGGIVVPSGDEMALAKALTMLSQDEKQMLNMGNAARNQVENFRMDKVMDIWLDFFPPTVSYQQSKSDIK